MSHDDDRKARIRKLDLQMERGMLTHTEYAHQLMLIETEYRNTLVFTFNDDAGRIFTLDGRVFTCRGYVTGSDTKPDVMYATYWWDEMECLAKFEQVTPRINEWKHIRFSSLTILDAIAFTAEKDDRF